MKNHKPKVLLVEPSYSFLYEGRVIKQGAVYAPNLGLATLAGALVAQGANVVVVDLNKQSENYFLNFFNKFDPDYIGLTFTTPLFSEALRLARLVKQIKKSVIVMCGGAHPTVMPQEVSGFSVVDVVCIGESDYSVCEVVQGKSLKEIRGIAYKENNDVYVSSPADVIRNLDGLSFPEWSLFDLPRYKTTQLLARKNPVGLIETSRGCPYGCVYCNKKIFGTTFRTKSVKRVIEEIKHMLRCGFKEIHIADDCFSFDMPRAKMICEEICKQGINFTWAMTNGIRVDRVDQELLRLMKKAGCYRISFGIESGDDQVLIAIQKGTTTMIIKNAVEQAKKAGLEVFGFFMMGLPSETEVTMQKTIKFAVELNLDMAKVSVAIPFPGTKYYDDLKREGRLKETSWLKYNCYSMPRDIYDNQNVTWDLVESYYHKFYREFYFRPNYISRRIMKSLLGGRIISDIANFLKTRW